MTKPTTTDLVERVAQLLRQQQSGHTHASGSDRAVARAIIEEVAEAVEEKIPGGTDIGLGPRENQGLVRVVRWLRAQTQEEG